MFRNSWHGFCNEINNVMFDTVDSNITLVFDVYKQVLLIRTCVYLFHANMWTHVHAGMMHISKIGK